MLSVMGTSQLYNRRLQVAFAGRARSVLRSMRAFSLCGATVPIYTRVTSFNAARPQPSPEPSLRPTQSLYPNPPKDQASVDVIMDVMKWFTTKESILVEIEAAS